MIRRASTAASLIAVLAVGGLVTTAVAKGEVVPENAQADARTTTGIVEGPEEVDGRMVYFLVVGEDRIELSFGPSWFWGALDPLHALAEAGTEVSIGGNLQDGLPDENASDMAQEQAFKDSVIKVRTIDGSKREAGKPPWAGGPKVVGKPHPGYEGWSKGQAEKDVDKPDTPGRPIPLTD